MAVKRTSSLIQAREAIGVFVTEGGDAINVVATRDFYRLLSQWNALLSGDGALAATEDGLVAVAIIVDNNTARIEVLEVDLDALEAAFDTHTNETSAHGANGDIIGNLDLATIADTGVVNQAADVGAAAGFADPVAQAWANTLRLNLQAAGVMA